MSFTRGFRKMGGFGKPGEELKDIPSRHSRDGWVHVADRDSTYIDGKQYRHMREWQRPCAICSEPVVAFEKVGTVDANSRFSNRTCKEHRGLLPAFEKGFIVWSKEAHAIVPGVMCGAATVDAEELTDLKQRLKEAYELNEDMCRIRRVLVEDLGLSPLADGVTPETVRAAIGELKRQLAKYELQPAIAQVAKNNLPWS